MNLKNISKKLKIVENVKKTNQIKVIILIGLFHVPNKGNVDLGFSTLAEARMVYRSS